MLDFPGMRASDNQSPVLWENGCRTARPPPGKSDRVVRSHRMACSLAAIFVVLTAVCAEGSEPKRVLVVHSFGSVAPPFTTHSIAFETELGEKMGERVDLDEVSLDMARYSDSTLQEALVEYLQKRQSHWQPDLVVPIGSPAGVFVAQYRDRLFPETPILYTGMDRRRLPLDALEKNAAFIGETFDVPGFIEDILQIAPATKKIAVVIGASAVEQYWAAAFRREFEPFTNRVNFIWLNDLSLDQMLEKTRALPPDSYIFLVLLLRDATGVTHNADEALQRIHAVANAPINGIFQHQLGLGIVGGRLYQAELEGIESAHIAVRILHGEPASSFPPKIVGPLPPRYDWRELKRWKINEKDLPPGSTVVFRERTVWDRFWAWITAGVSICILQALLITGLVANLVKRHRAERSLTESEQRFQNAADAAPVLMWMAGPDKRATFFNKAWLNFTGRMMEQELGDGWADDVHEDDIENTVQRYHGAFDGREPFVIQNRLRRHDGEFRWVTASGAPRYDGQGNFLGYVGASIDITDLLRKEEALHESEERIALAAEAAHLGVWELNLATNDLWVSEQWRSLFQVKPGVPVAVDDVCELVHPDDRDRRTAALQKAIAENSGYEIEYRALLPDKTVRWIAGRARCLPNEYGLPSRLLGVSTDVTERKQAEELFRLATEASPTGTVLMNARGRIVLVNAHIEKLFNYERHELIDRRMEILIPDRFRAAIPGLLTAPQARTMGAGLELFGRRKDGSEFPVEIGVNPILRSEGRFVLASVIDTTERLHAQTETRRLQGEIAHVGRVSMMGQLASALAHELNQPIGAILRNAEAAELFMQNKTPDLEEIRAILADIRADDQRAGDVIGRMRALLKRHVLDTQLLDLAQLIGDVEKVAQPDAVTRHVKLTVNLPADLPPVRADRVHLQQVLLNLILNGMDSLNGAAREDRRVTVSVRVDAARAVEIAVSDTGHGIAAEKLAHIFDPFFTTKPDGMGMGLAISRTIVESHGGRLWAENNNGAGATFRFTLPRAEEMRDEGRRTRAGGTS